MSATLSQKMQELAVFAGLWKDPVVSAFFELLIKADEQASVEEVRLAYTHFASLLYQAGSADWAKTMQERVLSLETCCTDFASKDNEIPSMMLDAAMHELLSLSEAAAMGPETFFDNATLPKWEAYPVDLQGDYLNRLLHISEYGFGDFARYRMFRIDESAGDLKLKPIQHPDPVTFEDLYGYDEQHEAVIENTRILLAGLSSSNILLYGSAGTGKSATVKATVNLLADQGLRLVEVRKSQLALLPELLELLSANPLKFIIFIDDLSFQVNDDDFSALKAVLEGSVSARSQNTVIYATSNRRHLVKETFSDRDGDDVHRNDTMQETISLSDRFGLRILFEKPTAKEYKDIVLALADEAGLIYEEEKLIRQAESFALRRSGRSARAARQFIEQLASSQERKKG